LVVVVMRHTFDGTI